MSSKYTSIIVTGTDEVLVNKLHQQALAIFGYSISAVIAVFNTTFSFMVAPYDNDDYPQQRDDFIDWLRSGSYVGDVEWVEVAYGGTTELVRGSDIAGLAKNHSTHVKHSSFGIHEEGRFGTYGRSKPTELGGPNGWPDAKMCPRVFGKEPWDKPTFVFSNPLRNNLDFAIKASSTMDHVNTKPIAVGEQEVLVENGIAIVPITEANEESNMEPIEPQPVTHIQLVATSTDTKNSPYPVVVNLNNAVEDDFINMLERLDTDRYKRIYHYKAEFSNVVNIARTNVEKQYDVTKWRVVDRLTKLPNDRRIESAVINYTNDAGIELYDVIIHRVDNYPDNGPFIKLATEVAIVIEWDKHAKKYSGNLTKDDITALYFRGIQVFIVGWFDDLGSCGFVG